MVQKIIITGSAGFIGFHLSKNLLQKGIQIIGIDCLTDYYDVQLKKERLAQLLSFDNYTHLYNRIEELDISSFKIDVQDSMIVHLAAQAGVRHSIHHPTEYMETNLIGTFKLLEIAREASSRHLMIASTSSVYGNAEQFPLQETFSTSQPLSFYAATKKSAEVMAYSYSHLYQIPTSIFRFFTVYGPWGRPDMALFKFTDAIRSGTPIDVYNYGDMRRDFTYVEDLVHAICLILNKPPAVEEVETIARKAPYRILNIGNSKPEKLMNYISALEDSLGIVATKNFLPMQPGDVKETHCDSELLYELINYRPDTEIKVGIKNFVEWYLDYYI